MRVYVQHVLPPPSISSNYTGTHTQFFVMTPTNTVLHTADYLQSGECLQWFTSPLNRTHNIYFLYLQPHGISVRLTIVC